MAGAVTGWGWESTLFGPTWEATPNLSFETDKILQDFSFAGYRRGEVPLPTQPPGATFNVVTGYGADASGTVDSTVAIQNAINAAQSAGGGIVWMPAGTYRLSPQGTNAFCLRITASNVVLRGAGVGQTFLLNTDWLMRNKMILQINGPSSAAWTTAQTPTTLLREDQLGPTRQLPVVSVSGYAVGDHVIVRADPGDDWATEHLEPGWVGHAGSYGRLMYLRQIVAIDAVNQVLTIDIPTRYALKMRDNARVYKKTALIREVGLEGFSIGNVQHPGTTGWGESDYLVEGNSSYDVAGNFAIRFQRVRDGWIRNVSSFLPAGNTRTCHLLNNGVLLSECQGVTIKNAVFQRPQYGGGGGAGYMFRLQNSGDCLLQECTAEFNRHGIVLSHMASSGNVMHACVDRTTGKQTGATGNQNTSGKGSDHHMHFSHSNLIDTCVADNSYFEARYRPFGTAPLHNLTSAHGVYWNTEGLASAQTYVVHSQQSRYGYVIGTRGAVTAVKTDGSSVNKTNPVDHVEGVGQGITLSPFSLYREQRRRRLLLPTIEAVAEQRLLFPANQIVLAPVVRFGDGGTVPPDAAYAWVQTAGPQSADLGPRNTASLAASFRLPGTYTFQLRANRHGSLEDDFAATRSVVVKVLPAGWQELELLPVADAHVQNGNPDTNYNTSQLWMKWVNSPTVDREIFMRFDLALVAGRTVESAVLRMHAQEADAAATARTHWVPNDAWQETTLTWNTKPAVSDLLQTWPLAANYVQDIEVTGRAGIEAAGDGLLSLRHSVASQTTSATVFKYASRENSNAALRPRLRLFLRPNDPTFAEWINGFTSIPLAQRGATADPDGDGRSNFEEYALRTQPNAVDGGGIRVERSGAGHRLVLPGGATMRSGAYPQLEYSSNLNPGSWQLVHPVAMELAAADLRITLPSHLMGMAKGFFRVRLIEVP
jgi:hypothetical protein